MVASGAGVVTCEVLVAFHPLLLMPANEECEETRDSSTVVYEVLYSVVVGSGLIKLNVVDVYTGIVMVVICVIVDVDVMWTVVVASVGAGCGATNTDVVAIVSDTPLDGVLPFSQVVVPEVSWKR